MRVIITGSRRWSDPAPIRRAILDLPPFAVVIHGGARGADDIAAAIAGGLGLEVEAFPADWSKHGRAAGPLRNQAMIDAGADLVLAFPLDGSRGTWDCIRRAKVAGIEVQRWDGVRMAAV